MTGRSSTLPASWDGAAESFTDGFHTVQAHGCAVVVDSELNRTLQVTENAPDILGIGIDRLLSTSPRSWLDDSLVDYVIQSLGDYDRLPGARILKMDVEGRTRRLYVDAYRSRQRIVIELEKTAMQGAQHLQSLVNEALDDFTSLNTVDGLLHRLVTAVADLTGHERIFIGRFESDSSVEVVAEHITDDWAPLLNHRFPPGVYDDEQTHFLHANPVRHVQDIGRKTFGFHPRLDPETGEKPDLTPGLLRAVPTEFKRILSTMRIRGSLAVALRSDRTVWGILVSHTARRRRIPPGRRHAVRTLVQMATQRLFLLQHRAESDFREAVEEHRVDVLETFDPPMNGQRLLKHWGTDWARLFEADGQALLFHHEVSVQGVAPSVSTSRDIIDWIAARFPKATLWHCRTLTDSSMREWLEGTGIVGILAVRLPASQAPNGWWLLFRREEEETIRWIGAAPHASTGPRPVQRARPGSPVIVHERVIGHCRPWSPHILSTVPRLAEDLGVLASAYAIRQLTEELDLERHALRQANQSLERLAHVDRLTNVANRLRIEQVLANAISTAQRHGGPLSILLFDIDHFKRINDTHGHDIGDAVLVSVATAVQESLRSSDTVGRWGGEEFIVVAEHTGREAAESLAERLRQLVANLSVPPVESVTISIGVAEWRPGSTEKQMIRNADQAMYIAKESGRNRVMTGL